jgi:hypothetical protein
MKLYAWNTNGTITLWDTPGEVIVQEPGTARFIGTIEVEEPKKEKEAGAKTIWMGVENGCNIMVVTGTHKGIYDLAIETKSKVRFPELEVRPDGDYKFNRFFYPKWFDNCIVFPHNNEQVLAILTKKFEPAPKKTVVKEATGMEARAVPYDRVSVEWRLPKEAHHIKCTYEVEE